MRSPPQKTQTLRGCAATAVSKRAMTVGSIMGRREARLPEDRLFLGDKLIAIPKSHPPRGHRTAGPKFFSADFEEVRGFPMRLVGLREHRGGFPHLAIFKFHQADGGGRPADVELLALRLGGQVLRLVTETRGVIVTEKCLLLGGTDVLQARAAADFQHARRRGRAGSCEEEGERSQTATTERGPPITIYGVDIHSWEPSTITVISHL